ncbi:nitrogen fixation/metabolism regulation signal transduction histidine kinase [Flavobacterium sp. 28A]|uniref:sensor histidine kinase n=1 Tax=Flavobacterium sp. 28A TaxID=2735895 RepID=UPI00156F809D|nr:HAMP domain-containing sensor histidine kinase [Flavobacterium sp. 28A]NRT16197.1 nitrogen fixation/metabolism regulation signal transduction histidine kinase [Flavobacterium sp. 28A]
MNSWKFYNALFARVFMVIITLAFSLYLFGNGYLYSGILILVFAVLLCAEMYSYIKNKLIFYDKTILSILNNDFSANFPAAVKEGDYKNLCLLYDTLKQKQHDGSSKELIYRSIINNIDTAVLILEKENNDWNIFLMNDCFSSLFSVPKVTSWDYLKNYLPSLCNEIEKNGFNELKTSINIKIEQQEAQTFMLQTSLTKSFNKDYCIILLDSIQRVIEKKEKEAWINLMKIISHELMNSLTPIRSLSQNLLQIVDQDHLEPEDFEDIKSSISTIINRSDHLQFFVENYRKLAALPTPNKKPTAVHLLFEDCLKIMSPIFESENIEITNEIDKNQIISIDQNQIEQVIINLLTNSVFALKEKKHKSIKLTTTAQNNRFYITISDNGRGIENEIKDKIFLPFFTTRKDGAGIGLTLSKNSIEAHGGYLSHRTDNEQSGGRTHFTICFIQEGN